MKIKIAALFAMFFVVSTSFAQTISNTKMTQEEGVSSKGFRISLLKPILEAELKVSFNGGSGSSKGKLDNTTGLSIGYASLPIQAIGWTTNITYMEIKNDNSSRAGITKY